MLPFLAPSLLPPVVDTLTTPWTAKVSATKPHSEYPRPQMRRRNWVNLNGPWDLTVERAEGQSEWTGKILVPFPIESRLSGVQRPVPDGATLVYRRTFARPKGDRIVLHFGTVDWATEVIVNGQSVGTRWASSKVGPVATPGFRSPTALPPETTPSPFIATRTPAASSSTSASGSRTDRFGKIRSISSWRCVFRD